MSTPARVAITGLGLLCPIGNEPSAILSALREGRSGIRPLTRYSTHHLQSKLAGEVAGYELSGTDQTAAMGVSAARQAWQSAAIQTNRYPSERIGLCVGASGAGLSHDSSSDVFSLRFQPHEQAAAIASSLFITGPVAMFTCASAGSGIAIVHAMNLLRGGYCDLVVAGGAECLSLVNHESMDSMRLCSTGACSPFSGQAGLTVGEGSAFFILERLEDAQTRRARVYAELYSFGVTQDAYDVVAGNPTGEGLARAMLRAMNAAAIQPAAVDWIKANGTSNRDQDTAETLAVKTVFAQAPPLSAIESFIGHANGAAPALGLGLAVLAFCDALVPPTLNFLTPRPGCDLDYVPNEARTSHASHVLANSVGFGGSNIAILTGTPLRSSLSENRTSDLCITGVGVVSPFGIGFEPFIQGLQRGASAIRRVTGWCGESFVGLAGELRAQKASSKLTLLQRFALAAAEEAFASASLTPENCDSSSLGLFVGLCRGSAAARHSYADALINSEARKSISKVVLRMARFTVASILAQRFKLQGYGATVSEGFGGGLHALAHACIHLENSPEEKALLVVAADETGEGPARSLSEMNWLAAGHDGCYLGPYDSQSKGTLLAEGAVALVVERTAFAKSRGAQIRAHIDGIGLTASPSPAGLSNAIRQALAKSNCTPDKISATYGNGSGIWPHDEAELTALRQVLPQEIPLGCANTCLGFAESTSGLFHVAAALHGLHGNEIFSLDHRRPKVVSGFFPRQLLTAQTEGHRNAAVLLAR